MLTYGSRNGDMGVNRGTRARVRAKVKPGLSLLAIAGIALVLVACAGDDSSENARDGGSEAAVVGAAQAGAAGTATGSSAGITVTGTGTATGVPDQAQFRFGVTTTGSTAKEALDANSAAMEIVIEAVKGAGVAEEDIKTQQVSVFPSFSDEGRTIASWTASNAVSALIREIGEAGQVIDAAVNAGANEIFGPSLTISDTDELMTQAGEAAIAQARLKAQALAEAAGVSLGGIVSIVESGAPIIPAPFAAAEAAAEFGDVPIEPGTQEVRTSVTVTFAIS